MQLPAKVYRAHSFFTWAWVWAGWYLFIDATSDLLINQLVMVGICLSLGLLVGVLLPKPSHISRSVILFAVLIWSFLFAVQLIWLSNLFAWLLTPLVTWWVVSRGPYTELSKPVGVFWFRTTLISLIHGAMFMLLMLLAGFVVCGAISAFG